MSAAGNGVRHSALFGRYELGKLLGCGAFAKVYHARDARSSHGVAIKVLNKKKICANPSLVAHIKREITIMSRLDHPHVVHLHEVMASKSKIYFVMELVKGGELFNKIAKQGRFNEDLSRHYFQQLISAVGYCHARGVYHRDLKPENLLVDEKGNLKVSDFGLSALTDQIRPDGLLHTLCGTPAYVAPEILTRKGYDGAEVDVWSCGVVLFVLAAGYLPFTDSNLMALYKKIYKGEYRCPKWMSPDLKRFLSRLLDTNPETRITIDEIIKDPWFVKGGSTRNEFYGDYQEPNLRESEIDKLEMEEPEVMACRLNAFDLISFSSGLDLNGLFDESYNAVEDGKRFVSSESVEKLIEKIEKFARAEKLKTIKRKGLGFEMEGRNGKLMMRVEIYPLNERLSVVEGKRRGGDAGFYREIWGKKLRPELIGGWETEVSTS